MNHQRSSGAPLCIKLGEKKRELRRLTRRDFSRLESRITSDTTPTVYDVYRWSQTAEGSAIVIALASIPEDSDADRLETQIAVVSDEKSNAWGSISTQTTVASLVVAESLLTGEEEQVEAQEDKKRSDPMSTCATMRPKRSQSRPMRRGLAILGRLRRRGGTRR